MENKVIAKEYVEKNYIHKDVIREELKKLQKHWDEYTNLGNPLMLKVQIDLLKRLLEDK